MMTTKMRHKRHVVENKEAQAPDGELQGKYTTVAELFDYPHRCGCPSSLQSIEEAP